MFRPTPARIRHLLDRLSDPLNGQGLVAAGRVLDVQVRGGVVTVVLEAPSGHGGTFAPLREAAAADIGKLWGVKAVQVALTTATPAVKVAPPPKPREVKAHGPAVRKPDGVRHVIAVASTKGGVGKSTMAVNLALALQRQGLAVGLLDADIYGPSAPVLLNLSGKPDLHAAGQMIPHMAHGLKVLSMGFVTPPDQAMIWRGPMASGAVAQLLTQAAWAPLDVLVIDMPPGTGDIHLTLAQNAGLSGAVVVTTPQTMALADVIRGTAMLDKLSVPILGVIENMAWFEDPSGQRHALFGDGGGRRLAEAMGVPFLGAVPMDISLRQASDDGAPLTTGPSAALFDAMAAQLWAQLVTPPIDAGHNAR